MLSIYLQHEDCSLLDGLLEDEFYFSLTTTDSFLVLQNCQKKLYGARLNKIVILQISIMQSVPV